MRRDPHEYLRDAYQAGQALNRFRDGKSFADYEADDCSGQPSSGSSRSLARR
jgi:hypothetical protein